MRRLKVLVIGTGSIGCRHIENLLSLGIEVSAIRYRSALSDDISRKFNIKVFCSLDEAINSDHDAAIIANRTSEHIHVAMCAARKGLHLFIEKPLSNDIKGVEELQKIVKLKNLVVEIGCMMRFDSGLNHIKRLLAEEAIGTTYFARVCVGQYLPDWRPDQDYRNSYSAKVENGGGVLFDLIHELDYLYWLFGDVIEVSAFLDYISDLEIETEDIAQLLLRFKNRIVAQIEMDYVSPIYRRRCEIVGNKGIITWNYVTGEVILVKRGETVPKIFYGSGMSERNKMFVDHMRHFITRINTGAGSAVSLDDGIKVLKIALAAHKSSIEKVHVAPEVIK